jgi:hypothetical protein
MTVPGESVDELVGATEAGRRLGLSGERIRQLSRSGTLPPVAGRIGRQDVWRWRDLEGWAITTGRLLPGTGDTRQLIRAWLPAAARLRRIVDEVMPWGRNSLGVVHVRIWEPTDSQDEPSVVLLGGLEDSGNGSLTNGIEEVAMLVGVRWLGARTLTAQFYEHWSRGTMDGRATFHHVTFDVGRHGRRRSSPDVRALGGELANPVWRSTTREEIERLVGEPIEVYTPGTYTAELVRAVHDTPRDLVTVRWDPDGADLAARGVALLTSNPLPTEVATASLTPTEMSVTVGALARHAVNALEGAAKFTLWQDPDAPVHLIVPDFDNGEQLRELSADSARLLEDHRSLWTVLGRIREVLARISPEDCLQLVPACSGGFARLPWWEAGISEPDLPGDGLLGPIARLGPTAEHRDRIDDTVLWRTAEFALIELLTNECDAFFDWDTPAYHPTGPLSAIGPTARRYLQNVTWSGASDEDHHRWTRLQRLAADQPRKGNAIDPGCGYDPGGAMVASSRDKKTFWVEWPVGDLGAFNLRDTIVRADPSRESGQSPVFLERSDGMLSLLPASKGRTDSHEYAWGYYGTGPANLTAAIVKACLATARQPDGGSTEKRLSTVVRQKVASGRTPSWRLGELLDEASRGRIQENAS